MRFKRIDNYRRYVIFENSKIYNLKTGKYIVAHANVPNYYKVRLTNDQGGSDVCNLHRLVAETFIPNPNNLSTVDHIDNNKNNNHVNNLQWLSQSDNIKKDWGVPVIRSDGKIYESITDAEKDTPQAHKSNICKVLNGDRDYCGGYGWEFMEKETCEKAIERMLERCKNGSELNISDHIYKEIGDEWFNKVANKYGYTFSRDIVTSNLRFNVRIKFRR